MEKKCTNRNTCTHAKVFLCAHTGSWIHNHFCLLLHLSLPSGVGYVDASQINALTAHYEERRKAEQRHPAADHGQFG